MLIEEYCGIIIVPGGSMFIDFGYFYPRIYLATNIDQSNELSCIIKQQTSYSWNYVPLNLQNFNNTQTWAPNV